MKTFKDYLTESKKLYSFKVKVAGELPEGFEDQLKGKLERCKIITLEKIATTPVQKVPLDFPNINNAEVTIFDVVLEYPVTSPEIARDIRDIGLDENFFRVRGSGEPSEVDQLVQEEEPSGQSKLQDPNYKEAENAKHKDYFGADYNKGFLKDLEKISKERKKELGQDKAKQDVLGSLGKVKSDKAGIKSPIGSK
jgi:hypothetical protein